MKRLGLSEKESLRDLTEVDDNKPVFSRRSVIKVLAGLSLGLGGFVLTNPFQPRFRVANASTGKTLIVIFQRGGCDGLNTIVPYTEADYYTMRPTIAIAPPDPLNPEAAIDLDGFFGLHPALAPFEPIFLAGDMAILPTVHYPSATRSHFDGQPLIETAASVPQQGLDGWLNRHLSSHGHSAALRAASFSHKEDAGLAASMRGPTVVSSFNDLTKFNLGMDNGEAELLQRLSQVYGQVANPEKVYRQMLQDFGQVVISDLSTINNIDFSNYTPSNGAVYPNTKFGLQLMQTAQLIKEGVGLELVALSLHKWDHHRDQGGGNTGGKQYNRFVEFAGGISACYQDLGSLMNDVVILTMTEFGRTARENGSFGTDHGNASAWFVIGKAINGGIYLGSGWPGLAPEQLHGDRDLEHTVDYRDVMGEILTLHLGNNDLATVLPGHTYSPIGFIT